MVIDLDKSFEKEEKENSLNDEINDEATAHS